MDEISHRRVDRNDHHNEQISDDGQKAGEREIDHVLLHRDGQDEQHRDSDQDHVPDEHIFQAHPEEHQNGVPDEVAHHRPVRHTEHVHQNKNESRPPKRGIREAAPATARAPRSDLAAEKRAQRIATGTE